MRPPSERIRVSASARAIETWRLPGRRRSIEPFTSTPSMPARRPPRSRSRKAAMRSRLAGGQGLGGQPRRLAEADDAGHVQRARPQSLLLSAALRLRLEANARAARAADVERAHSLRSVHLVCRDAHEIRSPRLDVEPARGRWPERRRCGRGSLARGRGVRSPRPACTVPISLFAAITETRTVSGRSARAIIVRGHDPVRSRGHDGDLEAFALEVPRRLEHGRVLDRGHDQVAPARSRRAGRARAPRGCSIPSPRR